LKVGRTEDLRKRRTEGRRIEKLKDGRTEDMKKRRTEG